MHYVVQENLFREDHWQMLIDALERLVLPYSIVRVFPFVDKIALVKDIPEKFDIDDLTDYAPADSSIFIFGATKLARIAQKRKWKPGSMANDNHDFRVYNKYYGNHMLNHDSVICTVGDPMSTTWEPNETRFIRPSKDLKSFTGKVFEETDWLNLIKCPSNPEFLHKGTVIQIAAPKEIQQEIRFWIVDNEIVTGSQYRLQNRLVLDANCAPVAEEFVLGMIQLFQPAQAFVMDVCMHEGQWKIVEINCINTSGFYKADVQRLLMSLERLFLSEHVLVYENKGLKR
jgi:hypothetical protein